MPPMKGCVARNRYADHTGFRATKKNSHTMPAMIGTASMSNSGLMLRLRSPVSAGTRDEVSAGARVH